MYHRLYPLLARTPLPLCHALGYLLGSLTALIPNTVQRITAINIRRCFPELHHAAQQRLIRQSLIEDGKTLCELPLLLSCHADKFSELIHSVSGEESLKSAIAAEQGVIIIAPHLGAWEIIGLYCAKNYGITSLYRPPRQAELEIPIKKGRERFGAELVPTTPQGVRALYKALSSHKMIGILPDQDPREADGYFAPFFGHAANTMTLLTRLQQKSSAQPILAYAERLGWGRGFHIHLQTAEEITPDLDTLSSITALNRAIEALVRRCPAQYQWGYRRFRTRPAGEPAFYS
ncbi:MAG: lipid A biosynthesis acyltransferase [Gammaproteobacteria bacterium]|nr:lipid A biosynthesis acyltransferase [Gammaproteobacteria bacterium]